MVLIRKLRESVRVCGILKPSTNWLKIVMLLVAANGPAPVKAPKPPPFALPDTFAAGILWPEASASADAGLVKYAYRLNCEINVASDHDVLMLIAVEPFDTPLGMSVKFTRPGVAVTVRDDGRFALNATGPTAELICADALAHVTMHSSAMDRILPNGDPAILHHCLLYTSPSPRD